MPDSRCVTRNSTTIIATWDTATKFRCRHLPASWIPNETVRTRDRAPRSTAGVFGTRLRARANPAAADPVAGSTFVLGSRHEFHGAARGRLARQALPQTRPAYRRAADHRRLGSTSRQRRHADAAAFDGVLRWAAGSVGRAVREPDAQCGRQRAAHSE